MFSRLLTLTALVLATFAWSAERDTDGAAKAAVSDATDSEGSAYVPVRPAKMPDLTKGDPLPPPGKDGPSLWNMGATGVIGIKNGGNAGDQVQVVSIYPGSPAEGKIFPGDVLLGVAGKRFVVGGDINVIAGDAIIKAEEEAGKGILPLNLWRDRNWVKRAAPKDVFGVDMDKLFKEAATANNEIYEWQGEKEQKASVAKMSFDKFPIDGVMTNITLQLRVMGTYSETSPWDCPVVQKVREEALKLLAAEAAAGKKKKRGIDWPTVLALVASGRPEYVQLAKEWVHTQRFETNMNSRVTINDLSYRGMQSWHHGFDALEIAIYYDATQDPYVLPEVRKRAILVALGQSGGGSWGHTFAFPEFNGGMLHGVNPGYGGMNNAGSRCFFLMTLARKAGITHPELDAAIFKASRFFSTYIDKGCIPYGDHSPWPSDDSNGKNYGVAYAFYTLGRKYEGQYFSMCSAHAAFSRRGGHGSPTLWYYTPLSANIAGPRATQASMRNMRPFYTLSRRHDGTFVFLGEQAPGISGSGHGMRNPTATVALHLSAPLKQLTITGKDADEKFWMNDKELNELLVSARGQVTDKTLLEKIGKTWNERSSEELVSLLGHFYPVMRRSIARELGKRYVAGEKAILAKMLPLLSSPDARVRDGACQTLSACGTDPVLENLSQVVAMLKDEKEFVRMTAAQTIGTATAPGDNKRELALLQAAAEDYPGITMDHGNVRNVVKNVLFAAPKKGEKVQPALLSTEPFKAGYDEELVRTALEKIVTMDPQGTVPASWSKDTLLKLAGPIVFAAEDLQINDAMFGGARKQMAQALLRKHGYREAYDGDAANLAKRSRLPRDMRLKVTYKDAFLTPGSVKKFPGYYRDRLDDLHLWLYESPVKVLSESGGEGNPPILTPLNKLIELIENDKSDKTLPSIEPDAEAMFKTELARAGDAEAQLKLCRKELENPARKNYFRKMFAMSHLVNALGIKALPDVSPFLGHSHWRLRQRAEELVVDLVKKGNGEAVIALLKSSLAGESGLQGNLHAAGVFAALVKANCKAAQPVALTALKHADPVVRRAAIQAVFTLGGDAELKTVFAFLGQATEPEDFEGCELALLSRRDDPQHVTRASEQARALLDASRAGQRRSLAYVLGQFGGSENIAALQKAALSAQSPAEAREVILALAFSPDRAADGVLIQLAKQDKNLKDVVSAHSVYRMVGRHGVGDVTDTQRMDFAEPMLQLKPDGQLIAYLGKIYTGRAVKALYEVMKLGYTDAAAVAIINAAENMEKKPEAERAIAAEVLASVIDYIEVTKLRGGYAAHSDKEDNYAGWKTTQAMAGRALLKVHKPKAAAIPTFNDKDLDL
jgi:HEAT repeat protein